MRPFYVFDRWGKQVGTIVSPLEAVHKDALNGEDSLTLTITGTDLDKGQRIVWRDKFQRWHEHTVSDTKVTHSNGQLFETAYCENSIAELLTDYIVEVEPRGVISSVALERALEPSRWEVGTVQPTGTHDFSWYHISAYEAVTNIVETFGAELATTIDVREDAVVSRKVDILNHRGGDYGHQFTFGRNLAGIDRIVSTESIYTALYGYGKGTQKYDEITGEPTGGYSRKITFGDINGGVNWVGDEEARLRYGVPDGKGGVKHAFGQVEFSDCEDPDELLRLTREALKTASKPQVSYTGEILNLAAGGYTNGEDSQTGDTVYLRDKLLDERLQGRVLEVERDLLDESNTKITLGNIKSTYTQRMAKDLADLDWLKDQSSKWDDVVALPEAYLDAVVNRLNVLFNTTGGFVYYEKGEGLITYDRPRDQNPTMAIQIMGAGFRIANAKNPDGSWDWRTFGTGDGFTADEMVTGVIKGGSNYWNLETGDLLFEQGVIHDAAGYNSWDLGKSELKISAQTQVGNLALGDYVANESKTAADQLFDERMTQEEIFNTLTGDGSTQGIYLQGGRVYINSTYIGAGTLSAGKIQDRNGDNYWDLETGEFQLSMAAKVRTESGSSQSLSTYVSGQASSAVSDLMEGYVPRDEFDLMLTQERVFNALTNDGALRGLFMQAGELYVNADFIRTGIIQGTDGNSHWNLMTGEFETIGTITTGVQSHIMHSRLISGKFETVMDSTVIGRLFTTTRTGDENYHSYTINSFSDLVLSAPLHICPGYNAPSDSLIYSYEALREQAMTVLTDVTQAGSTLYFKYRQGTVRHGLLCGFASEGTWNIYT